ncbi:MAG: thermonuclease family protein [Planctomycetota bacterium]
MTTLIAVLIAAQPLHVAAPPPGITLPVRIVEVVDGDTITVEFTTRARVRLEDCWAPETRTRDAGEKVRGFESAEHLRGISLGRRGLLSVSISDQGRGLLGDVFSFGRLVGRVYVGGKDLAAEQIAAGHATREKPTE